MSVLAEGKKVILRRLEDEDAERFLKWRGSGEWREYDAPWETRPEITNKKAFTRRFRKKVKAQIEGVPRMVTIVYKQLDQPVGWMIRYGKERFPDVIWIGIDICEDAFLERGLGSEALVLWTNYLWDALDVQKIAMDTWSINPRMMHVAEKIGYVFEGLERGLLEWQGERINLVHYGLLREERGRLGR